jgi:hypothetical protein
MASEDQPSAFYSMDVPMWAPDQLPAFMRGLRARDSGTVTVLPDKVNLSTVGASMNAFASIIIPADPDVPGDKAAGDLVVITKGGGKQSTTFSQHMSLLIERGSIPSLGVRVTEQDALTVMGELDEHARTDFGKNTFARLTQAQQKGLVDALLAATIVPLTVVGPDAAVVLQSLGRLMVVIVKVAYWTNFPEHRVRRTAFGFGEGDVLFSDPQNLISSPNDPNTVTGFDYLGWHFPIRKGVEDKLTLVFLEANVPQNAAASEAAFEVRVAQDRARTLNKQE